MPPLQTSLYAFFRDVALSAYRKLRPDFARRPDRSLGWAAMEAKESAALARLASSDGLGAGEVPSASALSFPPELLPFPPAARNRTRPLDIAKTALAWIVALHLCYLLATSILIFTDRFVDPPATVLMAYRKWSFGWRIQPPRPISLKRVPRYIRSMLIAIEDGKFYSHHGIDFEAFARASEINRQVGRPLYGGSTLTMQVARTLFLVPVKSYVRKYFEVLTALELEALLPKDRILELYFGYAEWGKGVFGIEEAARKWYGRGISGLTRDEAARLISLLSSPVKYGPETLQKNAILRERYRYLSARFDEAAQSAAAQAAGVQAPLATEAPPPSPEPGAETDAETATASTPPVIWSGLPPATNAPASPAGAGTSPKP